jgi:hypothetical protein
MMKFEENFKDKSRVDVSFLIAQNKTQAKQRIHIQVYDGDSMVPATIFKL